MIRGEIIKREKKEQKRRLDYLDDTDGFIFFKAGLDLNSFNPF